MIKIHLKKITAGSFQFLNDPQCVNRSWSWSSGWQETVEVQRAGAAAERTLPLLYFQVIPAIKTSLAFAVDHLPFLCPLLFMKGLYFR